MRDAYEPRPLPLDYDQTPAGLVIRGLTWFLASCAGAGLLALLVWHGLLT